MRGAAPYRLTVRIACDAGAIVGGIAFERYPRSGCGLVTYMVVAPEARRAGLGRALYDGAARALYGDGARLVVGEVARGQPERIARFVRWGARVLDVRYVQPALGPGLARDAELALIALPPVPDPVPGEAVRAFIVELYAATEGGPPEPGLVEAIADRVG